MVTVWLNVWSIHVSNFSICLSESIYHLLFVSNCHEPALTWPALVLCLYDPRPISLHVEPTGIGQIMSAAKIHGPALSST